MINKTCGQDLLQTWNTNLDTKVTPDFWWMPLETGSAWFANWSNSPEKASNQVSAVGTSGVTYYGHLIYSNSTKGPEIIFDLPQIRQKFIWATRVTYHSICNLTPRTMWFYAVQVAQKAYPADTMTPKVDDCSAIYNIYIIENLVTQQLFPLGKVVKEFTITHKFFGYIGPFKDLGSENVHLKE